MAEFQQGEVGASHTAGEKCPCGSPTGSTLLQRGKRLTQVPTEVSETQQTGSHQPRCRQCTQLHRRYTIPKMHFRDFANVSCLLWLTIVEDSALTLYNYTCYIHLFYKCKWVHVYMPILMYILYTVQRVL